MTQELAEKLLSFPMYSSDAYITHVAIPASVELLRLSTENEDLRKQLDKGFSEVRKQTLNEAAHACKNHMANCLFDKDIQKHWPRIERENNTYADLINKLQLKY